MLHALAQHIDDAELADLRRETSKELESVDVLGVIGYRQLRERRGLGNAQEGEELGHIERLGAPAALLPMAWRNPEAGHKALRTRHRPRGAAWAAIRSSGELVCGNACVKALLSASITNLMRPLSPMIAPSQSSMKNYVY